MRLLILTLLILTSFSATSENQLVLENGWVRAAPPMAKTLAGYGELRNDSSQSISIVSMASPFFKRVEAHKTSFVGGMMKMQQLENMQLEPGEVFKFSPGGMHFMLIKPNRAITENLEVPIHLTTESGEKFTFHLVVKK